MSRRPPGTLPLSGMQQAMWRAYAGRARAGADVEQLVISFDEPVRLDRLREAWNLVFENTPVLRARFVWDRDGEPGQVFDAAGPPEWNELDASGLPPQRREILWRQATDEDRRKGFDLRHGPLSRFCWVRWGPESTQIAWTFHHILLDGRSIPLVVEDVFTAYAALELGQVPRLPDRSGFEAFLLRRESWWEERAEEAEAFWTDAFRDRREPAPLAMDTAPAAHGQLGETAAAPFQLSPSLGAQLRERAAALGVGLSTLIHAAWGMLLCTQSGRPEVVFSTINAGRRGVMEGLDSVPGMFLTSPPVRFAFDPSARLGSLLEALRARSLAARPFEHAPPHLLARWTAGGAGQAASESVVVYDHDTVGSRLTARWGAGGRRSFRLVEQPDRPLVLAVWEAPAVEGSLFFDAGRFAPRVMARLAAQFAHLLGEMARDPGRTLGEVNLLPPDQIAELQALGRGPTAVPEPVLLHHWFERSAHRNPEAVAVRTETDATTYADLDARAKRLAARLIGLGAGPERLVAVSLPRSAPLVAAILGILKSGAAYLPIDPSTPAARLAQMLTAARPLAVVAAGPRPPELPEGPEIWVDASEDAGRGDAGQPAGPPTPAKPENLAYAIFTSGTTGAPKLVGVEHRQISNLLQFGLSDLFQPGDLACSPFTTAIGFDAAVHQIFAALALGGTLTPLPDLLAVGGSPFHTSFTWVGATPASLGRLIAASGLPPSVRIAGLGAEIAPASLIRDLRAAPHLREVYNFYGPTEATVYCTVARLAAAAARAEAGDGAELGRVGRLIGRPIANTRLHVVDDNGAPAPRGVPGELLVAGAGVARGYLNDPELTRLKFVPEPGGRDGARAYRTGDLVRWTEDGQLEFLGRRDSQLKVNGIRIELEEVESHLAACPNVQAAAVISRTLPGGERRLVGYVTCPAGAFDPIAIKRRLRERLPSAVVPSPIHRLDTLPLTTVGKLDRTALAGLDRARAADEGATAPEAGTETEARLLKPWAQLLRKTAVGLDEDFFSSGGDSLQAALLLLSVETEFGVKLAPPDLFENPTPREFAARIDQERQARGISISGDATRRGRLVQVQRGGGRTPIVAVPGGFGDGDSIALIPRILAGLPDHPALCFHPAPLSHDQSPRENLRRLIADIESGFQTSGLAPDRGVILWAHCAGGTLALELAARLAPRAGRPVPVALLDPAAPIGRWRATGNAFAYTRLGTQLRYHANMLRQGAMRERAAYARGVLERAFHRKIARREPVAAHETKINQAFHDWLAYPRAMLTRHTPACAGPLLLTVNETEATPELERAWRRLAQGGLRWEVVPGDHLSVAALHAAEVAASLRSWIADLGL